MNPVAPSRYVVYFCIALGGCFLDLATKHYVFAWLKPRGGEQWVWQGVFGFQLSLNEGALFGLAQGWVVVLALLSILALLGILYWLFVAGAAQDWLLTVALGSITAGILGNLFDRLGLHGLRWGPGHPVHAAGDPIYAVRDWIRVMIGPWQWPNFNLADSLLVCGAILLVWHSLTLGESTKKST